jgi:hypothetical protein
LCITCFSLIRNCYIHLEKVILKLTMVHLACWLLSVVYHIVIQIPFILVNLSYYNTNINDSLLKTQKWCINAFNLYFAAVINLSQRDLFIACIINEVFDVLSPFIKKGYWIIIDLIVLIFTVSKAHNSLLIKFCFIN